MICFRASMPPKVFVEPALVQLELAEPGRRCTRATDVLRFPVL